jgi:multidrug efflux pump subunit AcrA (membrane-fusion protein)
MLNKMKKFFNQEEEKVEMTTETVEASVGDTPAIEAVMAELSEMKASFALVSEELTAAKAELEKAQAALNAAAEQKAKAEADALAAKMAARRKAAEANMGTEKAAAFMAATEHMDDATFESLCNVFTTNATAEAESEMFNEVGVETKADAKDEPKVKHFKEFLPQKSTKKESK